MNGQISTHRVSEDPREAAAVARELQRLTHELVALGAQQVMLFGSRARGDARRGSDSDLLVVMSCPPHENYAGRLARIASAIQPRIAVDLVVYTPEEFERLSLTRRFVKEAVAQGVVLYAQ